MNLKVRDSTKFAYGFCEKVNTFTNVNRST